ncbi:hypothetical protein PT520_11995 [Aliarcobacter butzleri]|uniref:Restriction endonuclease n=1 Tax=Aliarcobacter butzleri TaxID=28197 RepID=A0AAW6VT29_9BACT|nr:hypothetical protein [Aliarcobacter butzleri]MDK2063239.1 hypothetical protein [Aliarcobacter butzleri]
MDKIFKEIINKYHPVQWLAKCVEKERKRNSKAFDYTKDLYNKTEFLNILSDIVIRISQNIKLNTKIPTDIEFEYFFRGYINTEAFKTKLIEKHGLDAMPLIMHEQIKFVDNKKNILGRMIVLYGKYEDEIKKATGLSLNDLIVIFFIIKSRYSEKNFYIFQEDYVSTYVVDGLQQDKIENFLDYFSITIKEYRQKLKSLGIDKSKLNSFRLIEKYPIIKIDKIGYIVPNIDNLMQSISSNLNIHLLEQYQAKGEGLKFNNLLGAKFEDYVTELTKQNFDNLKSADSIVPKNSLNSEFVIDCQDTSIVVEVKKLTLKRDTSFKDDIEDFNNILERHLVKAFAQVETTFNYVKNKNKIGIIVIFDYINFPTMINSYLKSKYPIYYKKDKKGNVTEGISLNYPDNILIMHIGSYEALMANSKQEIIKILSTHLEKKYNEKGDIIFTISELEKKQENSFLSKEFDNFASLKRLTNEGIVQEEIKFSSFSKDNKVKL